MKTILFAITLVFVSHIASAQKLDYNWISGIKDEPETDRPEKPELRNRPPHVL